MGPRFLQLVFWPLYIEPLLASLQRSKLFYHMLGLREDHIYKHEVSTPRGCQFDSNSPGLLFVLSGHRCRSIARLGYICYHCDVYGRESYVQICSSSHVPSSSAKVPCHFL